MTVGRALPLLLALIAAGASSPPKEITFQFRPQAGTYVETQRIARALQLGEGPRHEEITELERKVTVQAENDGYVFDI